mmetsp:Transcript_105192/g.297298  ORF Transcript_105192/g.297298 Transcript_105192/m.297298 type:complete len:214 (-) Transcript_105192:116-757(-)
MGGLARIPCRCRCGTWGRKPPHPWLAAAAARAMAARLPGPARGLPRSGLETLPRRRPSRAHCPRPLPSSPRTACATCWPWRRMATSLPPWRRSARPQPRQQPPGDACRPQPLRARWSLCCAAKRRAARPHSQASKRSNTAVVGRPWGSCRRWPAASRGAPKRPRPARGARGSPTAHWPWLLATGTRTCSPRQLGLRQVPRHRPRQPPWSRSRA